jgi:predicted amidophosphoribosyltransferase
MDDNHLINNKPSIRLRVETTNHQKGTIWLSAIYGDYNYSCEFHIPERDLVTFTCPHCSTDLKRKNIVCDLCGAPIVSLIASIGGRVSFCSRNSCKNHYVIFDDLDAVIRKFYDEYGYQ